MFDIQKNRFTDYLSGRNRVDLPAAPIIVGDHAAYISKIPLTKVLLSGNELAAALIKTHDIYKQDVVFIFSDVTVEAEAMGVKLDFPVNEMPKIKSCPDPEKIKSGDPLKDGRMPEILEAGRICVRELGDKAQVFIVIKDPFSLSVLLRGPEEFLKNCLKDPEENHTLLRITLENQISFLSEVLKTGVIPMIGAPYSSGSLISPAVFSRFAAPYLSELFKIIRKNCKPVFLHICGDTEVIFEEAVKLKPDVLSVDELDIPANSSPDIDRPLLMGNLSTSSLLKGKPEEIYDRTIEMIRSSASPFIPSTSCDVPMNTPCENIQAMLRAVRDIRSGSYL